MHSDSAGEKDKETKSATAPTSGNGRAGGAVADRWVPKSVGRGPLTGGSAGRGRDLGGAFGGGSQFRGGQAAGSVVCVFVFLVSSLLPPKPLRGSQSFVSRFPVVFML